MLRAKYGGLQPKKKLMPKVSTTSLNMMQGTLDKWPKFKGKCMRLAPPVPPSEGLLPDDPVAMHAQNICCLQEHKFFDSADWALSKQGVKTEQQLQQQPPVSHLTPKLAPSDQAPRRASHLGDET